MSHNNSSSVTVGIDVSDRHRATCASSTPQAAQCSRRESDRHQSPTAFERRFSGLEPTTRVALEAGTHSPWISRLLEGCGHEVLVANARKLRLIYAEAKKTDRLDAENLARLARLDPKLLSPPLAAQAPC